MQNKKEIRDQMMVMITDWQTSYVTVDFQIQFYVIHSKPLDNFCLI